MSKFCFKKICCMLLASLVLCTSACTEQGDQQGGDSSIPPTVESKPDVSMDASGWVDGLDDLNDKYKDKTFKVVSSSPSLFQDDGGTPIAKEVTARNDLIAEKLDIGISCVEKSASTIEKELRAAINSGKPYADLVCAPADVLARLAADGLLENLYSLPYVDFDAGYVNKAELEGQTVLNTMYMMSGLLTMDVGGTVGVFYNKGLLNSVGVDPYSSARNGTWTWSELETAARAVSGGSVYGIESLLEDNDTLAAIYSSCGGQLVNAGVGKEAVAVFDDSVAAYSVSLMNGVFKNGEVAGSYSSDEEAAKAFCEGKLAFLVAKLDNVGLLDGAKSEWGLVPLPKYQTSQKDYVSPVSSSAMAFAVPKGNTDSGFSGFVLNALLAASTDRLDKALKQTYVNYHFWSNDAALMLERIGDTKRVELGLVYSSEQDVYNIGMAMLIKDEITTLPADKVDAFNSFADKLFN